MLCAYCRQEIREGERRYHSHQAGMKGIYHWECFVTACRRANKVGAQEIEATAVSNKVYESYQDYDLVSDR